MSANILTFYRYYVTIISGSFGLRTLVSCMKVTSDAYKRHLKLCIEYIFQLDTKSKAWQSAFTKTNLGFIILTDS